MRSLLSATVALTILASSLEYAVAQEQRDTLRGVDGVKVVVEVEGPAEDTGRLSTRLLQPAVEMTLRQAGIPVAPEALVLFSVNVTSSRSPHLQSVFAYGIEVELRQFAHLVFTGNQAMATTWQLGGVGIVGAYNLSGVQDSVLDFVTVFVNDYLAVNSP